MFSNIRSLLGVDSDNLEQDQELDTLDMKESINYDEIDPEEILDDPNSPFEVKKEALQRIKDRYLKPREE